MSDEYYVIVHNNILWMGNEWWVLCHCPQQHLKNGWMSDGYYIIVHNNILWMGDEWWVFFHCPQQHLMSGWGVMSIISLSTTTSHEWVMSGEYYIIAHNNIYWMGDEWWVLYHCPQQHLLNGWWVVSIISLSTTTSYEWVMSGEYYIIVHNNILWMGDEWWVLYHCPQQHLMNGRWAVIIISFSTTTSYAWVMSCEYYIIVHNNILWMGDEWLLLYHCPQQHLMNGWWVVSSFHCPQQHLMNGRWAMIIISLSTTTSYEWVMSGDYYIIVHNNILWVGEEWWVLYHCPQQHLMNGWWVVTIISLSTTTSYEWVMSGEYYIIVHDNIYMNGWWVGIIISLPTTTSIEWVMSGEYYIIVQNNILWMGDEWWLLYHCPQQHLMNGRWVMIIISLSTATSYEWVMSGEYYIIVHDNIYWMGGDEWGWVVLYHCPQQHLLNGWWVVIIISLSTTTSIEWVMSGEYYIIVHNNILWMGDEWWVLYHCPQQHLWMGDEWWVLYHCPQQHLLNGWWVVSIISLSATTSIEWVMSGDALYHCPQQHLLNR